MIFNKVKAKIDAGIKGLNTGLPMGLDRAVQFIPGIQQSTYYLIGGESGSGKSAFAYNSFIFSPIDWYLKNKDNTDIKLKIIMYSFEIPEESIFIKSVCRDIYLKHGILLDVNYVLSRGKYSLSDEYYKLVMNTAKSLEGIYDILTVIDTPKHPTGVWYDLVNYASENGTGIEKGEFVKKYVPNNDNLYTIVIVDHIALTKKERDFNNKANIDKLSEYLRILRNECKITPVVVQQLNRSLSSTDRFRIDRVEPQLSDFKESGNPIEDANMVMALFSPKRYELPKFRGYDINKLQDRFRSLSLLKNRDGEADKVIGLNYIGECGYFREMPQSGDMSDDIYTKIQSIKKSFL